MGLGRIFKKVRKAFGKFKDKLGKVWNKLPGFAKVLLIGAVAWGAFTLISGAAASGIVPAVGEGGVAATGSFGAAGVTPAATGAATGSAGTTGVLASQATPGVLETVGAEAVTGGLSGAAPATAETLAGIVPGAGAGATGGRNAGADYHRAGE